MTTAYQRLAEIDANLDLSPDGRKRQRAAIGAKALADFQNAKELQLACEGVGRQLAKWQEMVGMSIKPPTNIAEASVYSQIRDRLYATKDKMSFVEKYAGDPVIARHHDRATVLIGLERRRGCNGPETDRGPCRSQNPRGARADGQGAERDRGRLAACVVAAGGDA